MTMSEIDSRVLDSKGRSLVSVARLVCVGLVCDIENNLGSVDCG